MFIDENTFEIDICDMVAILSQPQYIYAVRLIAIPGCLSWETDIHLPLQLNSITSRLIADLSFQDDD